MVDLTFIYDYLGKCWKLCREAPLIYKEIAELPWTLLLEYEYIVNRGYVYRDPGCDIDVEEYYREGRLAEYWKKTRELWDARNIRQTVYCPRHKEFKN